MTLVIYNITTKIDRDIEDEWITWQKEVHIPEIMALGFFYDYRFSKLLNPDDADGKIFVIQFYAKERDDYENYSKQHSERITNNAFYKWNNKFLVFESLLGAVQ